MCIRDRLIRYLQDKGYQNLPAASTATEILKRGGRISPEESEAHKPYRRFQKEEPNQLWQMDFKGHFAMADGRRCHPLTMSDDCSRKLLCLDAYDNERWKSVERSLLRVFSEYGLPDAILSDNGPPWACRLYTSCSTVFSFQDIPQHLFLLSVVLPFYLENCKRSPRLFCK